MDSDGARKANLNLETRPLHRRQSQQSRLDVGLRLSRGFQRSNDLRRWRPSTTESVSLCERMKSWPRFWNLNQRSEVAELAWLAVEIFSKLTCCPKNTTDTIRYANCVGKEVTPD